MSPRELLARKLYELWLLGTDGPQGAEAPYCDEGEERDWLAIADFVFADRLATARRVREACVAVCEARGWGGHAHEHVSDYQEGRYDDADGCSVALRALDLAALLEQP